VRLPLKGQATGLLTADGANTPALSLDQAFRIDLKVMTWNPDAAMWSVRHLFAQKVHGGSTRVGQQTAMVAPAQLNVEGWRFLESGCVVFLLCSVWEHARMFRERNAARRSTPRVNQLLQLSGEVTLLVSSLLYLVLLSMNLTLHIAASFPVYDDLYAAARFLLLRKRPPGVGGGGGSPCGGDVAERLAWAPYSGAPTPRWALADDARGLHELFSAIARLEQLDLLTQVYQILAALGLLLFVMGLVQRMGALNLRMRFVENVLECSKSDLIHLMAIIAPIGSVFVLLGHVMLGEQVSALCCARGFSWGC
jgi:hypothetical protein